MPWSSASYGPASCSLVLTIICILLPFAWAQSWICANVLCNMNLVSPDVVSRYGAGVAISGNGQTMLIGAPIIPATGTSGMAYFYERTGTQWGITQNVTSTEVGAAAFGSAVALDYDGTYAAISSRELNGGEIHVFIKEAGKWRLHTILTPCRNLSCGAVDTSGPIAMDAAGTMIAAGAPYLNGTRGGVFIFSRSGSIWVHNATLSDVDSQTGDRFGRSTALSADGNVCMSASSSRNSFTGVAVTFQYSVINRAWMRRATIVGETAASYFGTSLALNGNGTVALVGTSMLAYVFDGNASSWRKTGALSGAGAGMGNAVALNYAGNVALVGASSESLGSDTEAGKFSFWVRSASSWTNKQSMFLATASYPYARFGQYVSLDATGGWGIAGEDTLLDPNKRAVNPICRVENIYPSPSSTSVPISASPTSSSSPTDTRTASTSPSPSSTPGAASGSPTSSTSLTPSLSSSTSSSPTAKAQTSCGGSVCQVTIRTPDFGSRFGAGVAVSGNGLYMLVAASVAPNQVNISPGRAYFYERTGMEWILSETILSPVPGVASFGKTVALDFSGTYAAISGSASTIYVFSREDGTWVLQDVFDPCPGVSCGAGASGGTLSIDRSGTTIAAGAPNLNTSQGAVYVFTRQATVWTLNATLVVAGGLAQDNFGASVALSADGLSCVAGGWARNTYTGMVASFRYNAQSSMWDQTGSLTGYGTWTKFGSSVAVSANGSVLMVGASTALYVFERHPISGWQQAAALSGAATDAIAVNHAGVVALVGDSGANTGVNNTQEGAVSLWIRSTSTWTKKQTFFANNPEQLAGFGAFVSMDATGNWSAAGPKAFLAPDLRTVDAILVTSLPTPTISTSKTPSRSSTQSITMSKSKGSSSLPTTSVTPTATIASITASRTPTASATVSRTSTPTATAAATTSRTASFSASSSPSLSASVTGSRTRTVSPTMSGSVSRSLAASATSSPTMQPSLSVSGSVPPSSSFTPSPTSAYQLLQIAVPPADAIYRRFGYGINIAPSVLQAFNTYALILSPAKGNDVPGRAYIYLLNYNQRQMIAALGSPTADPTFGMSGALSVDAQYAVVGAPGENSAGAVYLFQRTEQGYPQIVRFEANTGTGNLGFAVAIDTYATTIVAGSPAADGGNGAVFAFHRRASGSWTAGKKLTAASTASGGFGYRVALSEDGSRAVVTSVDAYGQGVLHIMTVFDGILRKMTSPHSADWFGAALAINHNASIAVVGAPTTFPGGMAYIVNIDAPVPTVVRTLVADSGNTGSMFGAAVAMDRSGKAVVIGAPEQISSTGMGAAILFDSSTGGWAVRLRFVPVSQPMGEIFAQSVALSAAAGMVLAGSPALSGNIVEFLFPPIDYLDVPLPPNTSLWRNHEIGNGLETSGAAAAVPKEHLIGILLAILVVFAVGITAFIHRRRRKSPVTHVGPTLVEWRPSVHSNPLAIVTHASMASHPRLEHLDEELPQKISSNQMVHRF